MTGPRTKHSAAAAWWVLRRAGVAAATLLAASALIFAATQVEPGDAAAARLAGRGASPARIAELRHALGLNRPAWERYGDWLWSALHGDLGRSYATGEPVSSLITERAGNSLILGLVAAALLVPSAVGLGLWAGLRAGRTADRLVSTGTLALVSLPEFVIGTLLIQILAVGTGWLPAVSVPPTGQGPSQDSSAVMPTRRRAVCASAATT